MSTQDLYEKIEDYLSGSLNEPDLSEFEAQLQSDPDLATEVLLMKEIDEAVNDKSVLNFQKMVQSESAIFQEKNNSEEAPVKSIGKRSYRFYISVAATILFLVTSIFLFWKNQSTSHASGQELFAQHFEVYDLNQKIRSGTASDETTFQSAIQLYQDKKYVAATTNFQQLVNADQQDMVLAFCLANAALNQNPPSIELAETQFRKIINNGESIYVLRSKWYLSLILLEKEKLDEAIALLKELALSPDNLGQKAKAVLRDTE